MVSPQRLPAPHALFLQHSLPASRSRLNVAVILAAFLLLFAAIVSPAVAEVPDCYSPQIVSIDTPDFATLPGEVMFRATVNGCTDCTYRWTSPVITASEIRSYSMAPHRCTCFLRQDSIVSHSMS